MSEAEVRDESRMPFSRRALIRLGMWASAAGALLTGARAALACPECGSVKQAGNFEPPRDLATRAQLTTGTFGASGVRPRPSENIPSFPARFLTDFYTGEVSRLANGQTLREYHLTAFDRTIEVAPSVEFPAWCLAAGENASADDAWVPGPTIRCTEGDRVRIHFHNRGSMPHTLHFHGVHPAEMDGVDPVVKPDETFTYEFDAEPFGLMLYHCHVMPLRKHIHRGLYGTFLIDPKTPRPPAKELVMVMNGFDVNFDGENEFYTVNGYANYYYFYPIRLRVNEKVRVYLVNLTEFDLINSMHIHANMFHLYRTGTKLVPDDYTDTVMLCQGERCILEFSYKFPGLYMFHAHQSEFAELGWMGFFDVVDEPVASTSAEDPA